MVYKGWYKTRSGKSCGKKSSMAYGNDEFSDIVNAALVYAGGGDASGIFPSRDLPWQYWLVTGQNERRS